MRRTVCKPGSNSTGIPGSQKAQAIYRSLVNDLSPENLPRYLAPQAWDEDRTRYQPLLVLKAETFCYPPLLDVPASQDWSHGVTSPSGNYRFTNRTLEAWTPLGFSLSPVREGVVLFDGDVQIPTLFDLSESIPYPWMSLTPSEMVTQRAGIKRASGTVLVGGLGLGWFLKKVHDRPEVERVILVDSSPELLDWYGNDLCRQLPKVSDVVCGDVYAQIGRFGPKTKYLLDIWKKYGECLADQQFLWHQRKFKHVWGWGQEVAEGYPVGRNRRCNVSQN